MANKKKIMYIVIAAICVMICCCILIIYAKSTQSKTAVIYYNGSPVRKIQLDEIDEPIEFDVTGDNGSVNTIRAERGRICMKYADCPDKLCVNQGWIHNGIVPVVCLPNKVTIEITGAENDADARTN